MKKMIVVLGLVLSSQIYAIQFNFLASIFNNKNIAIINGVRQYRDGTYAKNCNEYKNPINGYKYSGHIGDGLYKIKPDSNPAFQVYCNMTGGVWDNFAGGYTLVGLFNSTMILNPPSSEFSDGSTISYLSNPKYVALLNLSSNIYHTVNNTIVVKTAKSILPNLNCYKNDTTALPEILGTTTYLWFHAENTGCTASGGDHSEFYVSVDSAIVFSSAGGFSSYWTGTSTTFKTDTAGYDIRYTFPTYSSANLVYMYVK